MRSRWLKNMPGWPERPLETCGLGDYLIFFKALILLERVKGIEPSSEA